MNANDLQKATDTVRFRVSGRAERIVKQKAKRSIIIKSISFLLMIATLITSIPLSTLPAFSEDNVAYITKDNEKITSLKMSDEEKIILEAKCDEESELIYKWQILEINTTDRWLDIAEATSANIAVSAALIESMTSISGKAHIRCVMNSIRDEYVTDPLEITLTKTIKEEFPPIVINRSNYMMRSASFALANSADTATAAKQASAETDSDTTEYKTCSIIVNYLFDNNGIAYEPYGATIAYGEPFSTVIEPHPILGYEPFRRINDEYVPADKFTIEIERVYEDVTINVIYLPALVEYQVHHHFQNLHDDEYSITADRITYGLALTGSIVPDGLALQIPGYTSYPYEKLTVAADGSTTIEIRYDRNYYLVDFDMDGGYGTEPVYTKYGQKVGANVPIKHGYVFDGWELVSYDDHTPTTEQKAANELLANGTITVPDANLRYRARWITQNTTYTMVFWKENANDNGYSYWGYLDNLGAMSGSLVSGQNLVSNVSSIKDEQYFTFNSEKTDKNVIVEGDGTTVVNVYYTRKYYTLTIKATGICTIPEGHTHTDECYDIICGQDHVHSDECLPSLSCEIPLHTEHTEECIGCGSVEHTHGSSECSCKIPEHTHTKACWGNVVGSQQSKPGSAPSSPADGYVYKQGYTKRIYIKGIWYTYSGQASNKVIVDPSCKFDTEHTHETSECGCTLKSHIHTDSCYRDELHIHGENCYTYSCGKENHIHSSACQRLKCGITENHKHTSTYNANCTSSSSTNVTKIVYRKYEQSLDDIWPITDDNGKKYDSGQRWKPSSSSYYTQVLVYISQMPPDDFTLTLDTSTYSTYTMKYYLELLPDQNPENAEIVTYNDRRYVLSNTIKANYNYVTKAEDFFDIHGFTQYQSSPAFSGDQIKISSGDKTVKFYYNRISGLKLEFNNNGNVIDEKTHNGLVFGDSISQYNFTPEYPTNLETNAYTFGGWYTTEGCYPGTEVDWETTTMPIEGLLLYAKWEPIKHKVNIYLDHTLTTQIGNTQMVDHNSFAVTPTESVTNGAYVFLGWFYRDRNGEEKAFIFSGIPIRDDMNIYAKWTSRTSVKYKIEYKLKIDGTQIADPTLGDAIAGNNRTFDAKAGDQLYEGYREGFYPLTNSHTITMSAEKELHVFTFEYVYVPSMPYTVRYLDNQGNKLLDDKIVTDNNLSVVTETFVKIPKMMPDAYQKRLVLSAEDKDGDGVYDNNVITFYYSSDEVHAYYKVTHNIQSIGNTGYREYRSDEFVGVIGESYLIETIKLTGFAFNGQLTKINAVQTPISDESFSMKLGEDGVLIELYYDRLPYNYTVKYTNAQTNKPIISDKTVESVFGASVIEYALDFSSIGYKLENSNILKLTVSADESKNVIEFLYTEAYAYIKYEIIGPVDSGILSQNSEHVKAISGIPVGSIPTAKTGYRFVGWYADINCTIPIDESIIDLATNMLKPTKPEGTVWTENITYYAKFAPKESSMTIINSGWNINDSGQSFIYRIQGKEGTESAGVDITFSISGNGYMTIHKLPIGEYTITQLSDWSWRYETKNTVSITLDVDRLKNTVEFINVRSKDKWLDGANANNNVFN